MLSFPATNKVIFHDLTFQIRHQNKFLQAPDSHLKDFFFRILHHLYICTVINRKLIQFKQSQIRTKNYQCNLSFCRILSPVPFY